MTRGQNGSLLLFCGTLSFPAPCRFIPAHFVSIRGPMVLHAPGRDSQGPKENHWATNGHECTRIRKSGSTKCKEECDRLLGGSEKRVGFLGQSIVSPLQRLHDLLYRCATAAHAIARD